jgi:hypothetical protein
LLSCFHIGCNAHLEQLHQYLAHYILNEIWYINVGFGQKLFFGLPTTTISVWGTPFGFKFCVCGFKVWHHVIEEPEILHSVLGSSCCWGMPPFVIQCREYMVRLWEKSLFSWRMLLHMQRNWRQQLGDVQLFVDVQIFAQGWKECCNT